MPDLHHMLSGGLQVIIAAFPLYSKMEGEVKEIHDDKNLHNSLQPGRIIEGLLQACSEQIEV